MKCKNCGEEIYPQGSKERFDVDGDCVTIWIDHLVCGAQHFGTVEFEDSMELLRVLPDTQESE